MIHLTKNGSAPPRTARRDAACIRRVGISVLQRLPKPLRRVRLPYPAPKERFLKPFLFCRCKRETVSSFRREKRRWRLLPSPIVLLRSAFRRVGIPSSNGPAFWPRLRATWADIAAPEAHCRNELQGCASAGGAQAEDELRAIQCSAPKIEKNAASERQRFSLLGKSETVFSLLPL